MIGVSFSLATAFLVTAKDLVSKKLSFNVDGTTSAFASFTFALPYYFILLIALWLCGLEKFAIQPAFFSYILLRALSDTFAETFKMHALSRGEFSVIMPLISLHPAFMLVTSPFITGDELTPRIIAGVIITVLGSTIIVFQMGKTSWRGVLLALCCAFFFSLNNCFDRLSVQTASPTLSGMMMTLLAALFLVPAMILQKRKKWAALKDHQRPFFLRGFFEVLFMVCKLTALQYLQGPIVTGIMRLSVLFSVVSGGVVFKEKNLWQKLLGAAFTLGGVMIMLA